MLHTPDLLLPAADPGMGLLVLVFRSWRDIFPKKMEQSTPNRRVSLRAGGASFPNSPSPCSCTSCRWQVLFLQDFQRWLWSRDDLVLSVPAWYQKYVTPPATTLQIRTRQDRLGACNWSARMLGEKKCNSSGPMGRDVPFPSPPKAAEKPPPFKHC